MHIKFRTLTLLVSIALLYGVFIVDVGDVRTRAFSQVVSQAANTVGMTTSVRSNEYNTLAQQLRDKESDLLSRERELDQERAELATLKKQSDTQIFIIGSFVALALFSLILVNFVMDWKRRKEVGQMIRG